MSDEQPTNRLIAGWVHFYRAYGEVYVDYTMLQRRSGMGRYPGRRASSGRAVGALVLIGCAVLALGTREGT